MNRWSTRVGAVLLIAALLTTPALHAQYDYVVYDPWSEDQLIYQVFNTVQQIITAIQQYNALVRQYARLPVNLLSRYGGQSVLWTLQDLASLLYGQPVLGALNTGDTTGRAYRQTVSPLDNPSDILGRMPGASQQRLGTAYATVELSDGVAKRGIDQVGAARAIGTTVQQTIRNMEQDASSVSDSFQTQTGLLQKINAASVLGLRLSEQTNQFLLSTVEQLVVDTTRKRETEATLMDARIYHWRHGPGYGADLFRHTAAAMDTWRLP